MSSISSLSLFSDYLRVAFEQPSFFQTLNGFFLIVSIFWFVSSVYKHPWCLKRLAFVAASLFMLFYQLPLFLYSSYFKIASMNYYLFALVIHCVVFSSFLWVELSSRCSCYLKDFLIESDFDSRRMLSEISWLGLFLATAFFTFVYLLYVPFSCTGFYAMLVDPKLLLLAREFSVKLSASLLSSTSYGILSNALIPLIVGFLYLYLRNNGFKLRVVKVLLLIFTLLICLFIVLLPGIKGMLFPTFVMCVIVAFFSEKNWFFKVVSSTLIIVCMFGSIASFLFFKDKVPGFLNRQYNAGYCAVTANKCVEAMSLVDSLFLRSHSLELNSEDRSRVSKQVYASCSSANRADVELMPSSKIEAGNDVQVKSDSSKLLHFSLSERLTNALYRAFVLPIQVASWHFLYATENPNIGLDILPAAKRFLGKSTNVATEVYQRYGSVYSGGDKTSTSTAPTSFLLFYPAFIGLWGLGLAICLLFFIDFISTYIFSVLTESLRLPFVGLIYIGCLNFMVSDFLTVLLSHGLAAGFISILMLNALEYCRHNCWKY